MADKVAITTGSPAFSLRLTICGLQKGEDTTSRQKDHAQKSALFIP
jgi:hypothetical protein